MEKQIISMAKAQFKDKDSGEEKTMYKLYLADDSGNVGCIYSSKEHSIGEVVSLGISVNKDGKFVVKIIEKGMPNKEGK